VKLTEMMRRDWDDRAWKQSPFRQAFLLTLGFALVFTALLPPGIYSIDGKAMLAVAESLVTHRGFTVPED